MPATNAVLDRAEDAIMKPPCKKLYGSAAVWRSPMACTLRFILGNSAPPRSSRGSLLQLQYTLKSCRFQKVVRNKLPGWWPTAADQTSPTSRECLRWVTNDQLVLSATFPLWPRKLT